MSDRPIRSFVLISTLLFFAGCTTAPDLPEEPVSNRSGETHGDSSEQQETSIEPPAHAPVAVRELEETETELPAVAYLLNQAEVALNKNESDRASALSARALQIDRKSPRAYLVLAQAYRLEGDLSRATASARQGLLYVSENSEIGRQLKELIQDSK